MMSATFDDDVRERMRDQVRQFDEALAQRREHQARALGAAREALELAWADALARTPFLVSLRVSLHLPEFGGDDPDSSLEIVEANGVASEALTDVEREQLAPLAELLGDLYMLGRLLPPDGRLSRAELPSQTVDPERQAMLGDRAQQHARAGSSCALAVCQTAPNALAALCALIFDALGGTPFSVRGSAGQVTVKLLGAPACPQTERFIADRLASHEAQEMLERSLTREVQVSTDGLWVDVDDDIPF